MGSGKTSVGRLLSKNLKLPFFDSDAEIEKSTGVDIPWIFEKEGESGFRQRESNIIKQLTKLRGIILATGGGTVVRDLNRELLNENGQIVYLKTSIKSQLNRITKKIETRPMFLKNYMPKKFEKLYFSRAPLYAKIADLIIITDELTPEEITTEIIKRLKK